MGLEIVSEGSCLVRPKVTKHKVTKVTKHKVTKVKHDQNESCPNKNTIELVCDQLTSNAGQATKEKES